MGKKQAGGSPEKFLLKSGFLSGFAVGQYSVNHLILLNLQQKHSRKAALTIIPDLLYTWLDFSGADCVRKLAIFMRKFEGSTDAAATTESLTSLLATTRFMKSCPLLNASSGVKLLHTSHLLFLQFLIFPC